MSPMYKQDPFPQGADAMASQSSTRAPAIASWPVTFPLESNATSTGLPESLCDHSRPGVARLTTSPLASVNPARRINEPEGLQLAGSNGGAVHAAGALTAIAAKTTITRFNISVAPSVHVSGMRMNGR
jgi:hypothetical protein